MSIKCPRNGDKLCGKNSYGHKMVLYNSGSQTFLNGGSLAKSRFSQGSPCKIIKYTLRNSDSQLIICGIDEPIGRRTLSQIVQFNWKFPSPHCTMSFERYL